MMKKSFLITGFIMATMIGISQDLTKFNLYKPADNAEKEIAAATKKARAKGKHVLIQIGNNRCIWCARFIDFITTEKQLDSMMNTNYVVYHLNNSQENNNAAVMTKYKEPQKFGFPVFLVLDRKGKLIHTQNSVYLKKDKGYDRDKVMNFFEDWSPKAFDPKQYKEQ